ncbi:MAG: hypothetical protein V1776_01530 [Candidatus Diapherotrites archaeon]
MVYIRTEFYPFRLVLARREPVQLTLDLRNDGKEERAFSIELEVGRPLSLERAGAKIRDYRQIGNLLPGQQKKIYYDIFSKSATDDPSIPLQLRVHEHPRDSKSAHDIIQSFSHTLNLAVQAK